MLGKNKNLTVKQTHQEMTLTLSWAFGAMCLANAVFLIILFAGITFTMAFFWLIVALNVVGIAEAIMCTIWMFKAKKTGELD